MQEIILKNNEKILFNSRTYFLFNFWPFLISFLILFLDAFFMFFLFEKGILGQSVFFLTILFALFLLFRTYFIWKKNIFIITNKRMIDIEQRNFFEKIISEFYYYQIEDVHVKVKGFFASLFKYGDLVVQIKNSKVKIVVPKIKNPAKIQQAINFLKEKNLEKQNIEIEEDFFNFFTKKIDELSLNDLIKIRKILREKIDSHEDLNKKN
jgi:hypothetical protein